MGAKRPWPLCWGQGVGLLGNVTRSPAIALVLHGTASEGQRQSGLAWVNKADSTSREGGEYKISHLMKKSFGIR